MPRLLVIDISNSFTKFAVAHSGKFGRVYRLPTSKLSSSRFASETKSLRYDAVVLSSVVPRRTAAIHRAIRTPIHDFGHLSPLGIGIDYPRPETIGADRLANAVACSALHGTPAIVVDFGTAVTFDVVARNGDYIGGVIAPGLSAMTEYLHSRTALLPRIRLAEPRRAIGKSTREGMLSGAVFGYRGLIAEIVRQVATEAFSGAKAKVVATGGDAMVIARKVPLFDAVDPLLTLHGLRIVGERVFG